MLLFLLFVTIVVLFLSCSINKPIVTGETGITIDHSYTRIDAIPMSWIRKAKSDLIIAYGHTSHGSQLITGMQGLVDFKGIIYSFNETGEDSALQLRDTPLTERMILEIRILQHGQRLQGNILMLTPK